MKKVPLRMCVVTRNREDKRNLLRIVKDKENNVFVDVTGKQNGKGAYITKSKEVLEMAKKNKEAEGPTIYINATCMFGGVDIK